MSRWCWCVPSPSCLSSRREKQVQELTQFRGTPLQRGFQPRQAPRFSSGHGPENDCTWWNKMASGRGSRGGFSQRSPQKQCLASEAVSARCGTGLSRSEAGSGNGDFGRPNAYRSGINSGRSLGNCCWMLAAAFCSGCDTGGRPSLQPAAPWCAGTSEGNRAGSRTGPKKLQKCFKGG